MHVLVLHDMSRGEPRFGLRRRLHHLTVHEEASGATVEIRSIIPASRERPGRAERLGRAVLAGRKATVDGFDKVVVMALWAPNMVVLARLLARRRGPAVQLDVCDSRRLSQAERPPPPGATARLRVRVSELVARAAYARLPSTLPRSYISQKDADCDAGLSASESLVVGPAPLPELAAAGPFVGRPATVLCPVDIASPEGRAAVAALREALSDGGPPIPVEVTGSAPDDGPSEVPLRWLGHVPTLLELYSRPCVVVSTNPSGHGVQNKLWEALQARRPIVAHDAALHWAPMVPWIHRVPAGAAFGPVLRAALATEHDTGSWGDRLPGQPVTAGPAQPRPAPPATGRRH